MATITSVIAAVKLMRPTSSTFSDSIMTNWILEFERKIVDEVMDETFSATLVSVDPLSGIITIDTTETLAVTGTYERVYLMYVIAQMDYFQQEFEAYNNSVLMFNNFFDEFKRWYIRNNRPTAIYWKQVV